MQFKINIIKFFIFLLIFPIIFTSCKKEDLVLKNNLLYEKGSDVPFTGREKDTVDNKIIEYDVKDGYKHGEYILYFENGNIAMQGSLDSNRNIGKWSYYYPNGNLESEGSFDFDLPDGKWIWNFEDGKIKEEGNFKNGIRVGVWYQYDENGKIIFEHNFEFTDSVTDDSSIQETIK